MVSTSQAIASQTSQHDRERILTLLERSEVRLHSGPIRVVGEHHVKLHLHTDVNVTIQVEVVAEDAASA